MANYQLIKKNLFAENKELAINLVLGIKVVVLHQLSPEHVIIPGIGEGIKANKQCRIYATTSTTTTTTPLRKETKRKACLLHHKCHVLQQIIC